MSNFEPYYPDSTLIDRIMYSQNQSLLWIKFKDYYIDNATFINFPIKKFIELLSAESAGKYYLTQIKNKYKMAKVKNVETAKQAETPKPEKKQPPKKINEAKDSKRFIKIEISVHKDKLNKDFFTVLENGDVRCKMTLMMLPNGEVDKYGRLGMIVQDVPLDMLKADKSLKGEILGNAEELEWHPAEEKTAGNMSEEEKSSMEDDLPF